MSQQQPRLRAAILDLNNKTTNRGITYLQQMLGHFSEIETTDTFEVRVEKQLPDLSYDVYISSGGPGSPWDLEGWGPQYFDWLESVLKHNELHPEHPKYVFMVCHSFQLAAIYFKLGQLTARSEESFGVWPCFLTDAAFMDPLFRMLPQEFYIADFRYFQLVQPDLVRFEALGAQILALEQVTTEPERAIMAVRYNEFMVGTQFHPEADETGMEEYLLKDDRKIKIIAEYGEDKYKEMIENVAAPDRIAHTYRTLLPNFLRQAINANQPNTKNIKV